MADSSFDATATAITKFLQAQKAKVNKNTLINVSAAARHYTIWLCLRDLFAVGAVNHDTVEEDRASLAAIKYFIKGSQLDETVNLGIIDEVIWRVSTVPSAITV